MQLRISTNFACDTKEKSKNRLHLTVRFVYIKTSIRRASKPKAFEQPLTKRERKSNVFLKSLFGNCSKGMYKLYNLLSLVEIGTDDASVSKLMMVFGALCDCRSSVDLRYLHFSRLS